MYRLLIVDDEEIIVNGLYEIFNSLKALELDVYKAYSGKQAIEWLNRTRIDIVLTDIRMPQIDGFQLMETIKKSWPQCKIIFLSGYNEFEYVYKAIQQDGVSYILKTEDPEKVIYKVQEVIAEIQNSVNLEDLIHKAKEQINMAVELFQKDYLLHLLREDLSIQISKSQFEQLGITMNPDKPIILLVGNIDNFPKNILYGDKIQSLNSVRLIMTRYLSTHIASVSILDENHRYILFIQPKDLNLASNKSEITDCFKRTISFLKGILEYIQAACRDSLKLSISFALSSEPCNWTKVANKYLNLNQLLNYRSGSDIEMIIVDSEFKNNLLATGLGTVKDEVEPDNDGDFDSLEAIIRKNDLDYFGQYLEAGQSDKVFELLHKVTDALASVKSRNNPLAIEAYFKISLSLLSYINRWKLADKIAFQIGQNQLMRINLHDSWQYSAEYLIDITNVVINLQTEEKKKRQDSSIYFIQRFIEEHLNEDLSLVRLAEQVYLNPSYLSRLYKQVTGSNLSEYIENARVAKAKELLSMENIKINEVASIVGYDTAASFTRFFKKICGCTPQEFQEKAKVR